MSFDARGLPKAEQPVNEKGESSPHSVKGLAKTIYWNLVLKTKEKTAGTLLGDQMQSPKAETRTGMVDADAPSDSSGITR